MIEMTLNLSNRASSHPIFVGDKLIEDPMKWTGPLSPSKGILVYDKKLQETFESLAEVLEKSGFILSFYPLDVSEKTKELDQAMYLYTKMIEEGLDRTSLLFSLGGGVIGDLCGFVASTFLRGIGWVNFPSTLVSQVDAAVGGKTGINHPLGKNLIGSIYQPLAVVCDTSLLLTLSRRDRISGLAEMMKYGLIYDAEFYATFPKLWDRYLDLDPLILPEAVSKCLSFKCQAVAHDVHDISGDRQKLNFGHTIGHAIEAATDYSTFRHGEAILLGMRVALKLSVLQGHLASTVQKEVDRFLSSIEVPPLDISTLKTLSSYTKQDKKIKKGKLGFVLLDRIGHALIDESVTAHTLEKAIEEVLL